MGSGNTPKRVTRPPVKQSRIVADLRGRIVRGAWAPGQRLPTRRELSRRFRVTLGTVQAALGELAADGLVVANGAAGTRVAARPPHLARYALAFPSWYAESESVFWRCLHHEAQRLARERDATLVAFHALDGHTDVADYLALCADAAAQRVAGVIFAFNPFMLAGSPLITRPDLPRVGIMSPIPDPPMPCVYPDLNAFHERALQRFAALGRRRVALVQTANSVGPWADGFVARAAAHGLETRPYWVQGVQAQVAGWARSVAHLLFHDGQRERPEALLIADDNLVEPATAGLVDAGVRVPEDLTVIGLANFPEVTRSHVPALRLGADAAAVMRACFDAIDAQRRGEPVPPGRLLPALFEDELARSPHEPAVPAV
jgi:DNA-binding LacI/PurR family transcriptional regulator